MKLPIVLMILIVFIAGCSSGQPASPIMDTTHIISGIQDLMLNGQDLQGLGLAANTNETYLQQIGITGNGTNCQTDEAYSNVVDSSIGQYSMCDYTLQDGTDVIIELQSFENYEALNGTYQYDTSHYYSAEGLISENDYGDQSRFRVSNENDYGGELNPPGVYFYHLWFTKGLYLVHITSKGSEDAKENIAEIGRLILAKFE